MTREQRSSSTRLKHRLLRLPKRDTLQRWSRDYLIPLLVIIILMMPLVYGSIAEMKSGHPAKPVKCTPDPNTGSEKIMQIVFAKAPNIMARGQYDKSG
jgi:hypothetical protein